MVMMMMIIITTNITKHIYNCKQYKSDSTRMSSTYESNMHLTFYPHSLTFAIEYSTLAYSRTG